jgi:hypothetical protein
LTTTTTGTFENVLFTNLFVANPPTPGTSPQTIGPTQVILAQQAVAPNNDMFISANTAGLDTTLQVDLGSCTGLSPSTTCGIFNPDAAYLILNENGAASLNSVITVTFSGLNSLGTAVTDTVLLVNGTDVRGTTSAQQNTCTIAGCGTSPSQATDSTPGGSGNNSVTVFNNVSSGTSGTLSYFMDVQEITGLNNYFVGGYLNSITIANVAPNGGIVRDVFSGLAIDQAPEPGTVVLFGTGLGLIVFWKVRNRRATKGTSQV